jgi:hypothetical protein
MDLHQSQNDKEIRTSLTLKGFTASSTKDRCLTVLPACCNERTFEQEEAMETIGLKTMNPCRQRLIEWRGGFRFRATRFAESKNNRVRATARSRLRSPVSSAFSTCAREGVAVAMR